MMLTALRSAAGSTDGDAIRTFYKIGTTTASSKCAALLRQHDAINENDYVDAVHRTASSRRRAELRPYVFGAAGRARARQHVRLLALGFHVTYAVSGAVNFAQSSAMMLGAVFAIVPVGYSGQCCGGAYALLCAVYGLWSNAAVRPFAPRVARG